MDSKLVTLGLGVVFMLWVIGRATRSRAASNATVILAERA